MSDRARLEAVIARVGDGLVERDEAVRLLVLAAIGGEHLLLIGPPGTAKSELARRLHRVFGGQYFERLLTRFSVPEELFGPLSLAALDEGRYERDVNGYLPVASIAFLDEVFKANSAILNALLTLLNERQFDQGAQRIAVPLVSLVAASNEVPDDETLRAFQDRFLLRSTVGPVSDEAFSRLLTTTDSDDRQPALLGVEDLDEIRRGAHSVAIEESILELLTGLRKHLAERDVLISDRRWVRAVQLLRVSAFTNERSSVDLDDLWLIKALLGEREDHAALIEDWFCELLGADRAIDPVWAARVADAFEQQLEREESATELAFDDSGKLSLAKAKTGVDDEAMEGAAPRMSAFSKRKRYSKSHINARIGQIDGLLRLLADFLDGADQHRAMLRGRLAANLWLPVALKERVSRNLELTIQRVQEQRNRLTGIRRQYGDLPLADQDDAVVPPPVAMPEQPGVSTR